MTIRIKIQNEDSRENAVVIVKTLGRQQKSVLPSRSDGIELKGGESTELYVYDGQSLLVEELKNG